MRLYWELAVRGFQRAAAYRTAAISGAITNTFFGLLRAYVFIALYEASPNPGGYDLDDTLTFVFITQGMAALIEMWAWWPIALQVQSGAIVADLARPYDHTLAWLAQDYGRALHQLILRSVPPVLVGAVVVGVDLPPHLWLWPVIALSAALAVTVSFGWRYCLNLSAFWFTDIRGAAGIALFIAIPASGFTVPLALYPDALRDILYLLPFASMIAIPIDIYLGKVTGLDLTAALAVQAVWAIAALLAGRLLLTLAMRRLTIQGG